MWFQDLRGIQFFKLKVNKFIHKKQFFLQTFEILQTSILQRLQMLKKTHLRG